MRRSGVGLTLLLSLLAPLKMAHAEAIMISGKLKAEVPEMAFDAGPGDFVAFVNNNTITATGKGTACNVTVDDRATSTVLNNPDDSQLEYLFERPADAVREELMLRFLRGEQYITTVTCSNFSAENGCLGHVPE